MSERKDFPQWSVDIVYEIQQGTCKCGASLEQTGFHKHHKDKDPTNNSIENLELLCPKCHFATFGESNPYTEHQVQEKRILEKLNQLIDMALENKLAGAAMERLIDAMSLALKVSRNVSEVDYGKEYTPIAIRLQKGFAEQKEVMDAYLEGFKAGINAVKVTKGEEE